MCKLDVKELSWNSRINFKKKKQISLSFDHLGLKISYEAPQLKERKFIPLSSVFRIFEFVLRKLHSVHMEER